MSSYAPPPDIGLVKASAEAVAWALGTEQCYAIVGGAACVLLGSIRSTFDVDFVVPKGQTKTARSLLKAQPDYFDVDKRTQHTVYRSDPPVQIEILTPPALFKQEFTASTPVVEVNGARILSPMLILNAKCGSVLSRSSSEKKSTDTEDIKFLLQWCSSHGLRPKSGSDVPNATLEFIHWFVEINGDELLWEGVGFDFQKGNILASQCCFGRSMLALLNAGDWTG